MSPRLIEQSPDAEELARAVAQALAARMAAAIEDRGSAHVVVTGGGIGTAVLAALAREDVDWTRVHVWWGDERFLPDDHPDRNVTQARAVLLDQVGIPPTHVHAMPADCGQAPEQAALDYADELARSATDGQCPRFDVLMLGVGPEGHVASIFPDSPAAVAAGTVVAVRDCPKPPPTRISMTFGTIRHAHEVWLIASGAGKAEAIARCLDPNSRPVDVPAAGALGSSATYVWVDQAAASNL